MTGRWPHTTARAEAASEARRTSHRVALVDTRDQRCGVCVPRGVMYVCVVYVVTSSWLFAFSGSFVKHIVQTNPEWSDSCHMCGTVVVA